MEDNDYDYTYDALSPKQKKEIEQIKRRYEASENDSYNKIKKLDNKAKSFPLCLSLTFGILGFLIFGYGITLVLHYKNYPLGCIVGVFGFILMSIAPSLFDKIYKKNKEKYKDEILNEINKTLNKKNN